MATLGNIRRRSGLLFAVIGIAMLAFILTDFMQSKRSGGGSNIVGQVHGQDISIQEYELAIEEMINNWKSQNPNSILNQTITAQLRSQAWDEYIKELIMNVQYNKIGVDVSEDEWWELLQGTNAHQEIRNITSFQDPLTGIFDRTKVVSYVQNLDQDLTGEAKERWIGFQNYLIELQKSTKYNSLLDRSMYITTNQARISFNEKEQQVKFNYVSIPYTSVHDSLSQVTPKEIKTYYKDHKSDYEQKASKDVDYVVFPVLPSEDDDSKTRSELERLVSDFTNYDDCILMAKRNSDNIGARFIFQTKENLEDPNWIELFDQPEGTVIGPYLFNEDVYRIARLYNSSNRSDSVEARHILIRPSSVVSIDSAQRFIEALKVKIEEGSDFGDLAQQYSEDQSNKEKGGELGWFQEGAMVDEFNDVCFTSKKGDLNIVQTQFGVHLINVMNTSKKVKKAKIVFIDRNVEPSTETFNLNYSKAAQFAGKILNEGVTFDSLIMSDNLVKRTDSKVEHDKQNISGLPNSREMVRWMNRANVGDVSEVFQFDDSYVVAYITKHRKEGFISLEEVTEQIKAIVKKKKKGDLISDLIKGQDLATIAAKNNTTIVNDKTINFANLSIQGMGYEPELIGAVFGTPLNTLSEPVIGNSAVYVFNVTFKDQEQKEGDFLSQKNKLATDAKRYSNSTAYTVLKENANIKDYRSDFY